MKITITNKKIEELNKALASYGKWITSSDLYKYMKSNNYELPGGKHPYNTLCTYLLRLVAKGNVECDKQKSPHEFRAINKVSSANSDSIKKAPSRLSNNYNKSDFLNEVFMKEEEFDKLILLLKNKKNVILQGAPGVGKTFSAKRLAWAMMEEKDNSCIEMIQFHQNYTYEDFVMGYKPNKKGGFDLKHGLFYNFCKTADQNRGKKFFFIIDEINRGNLSKIFGELLMLIENTYREKEIKLAYNDELFSVPDNLYIIGMMNTADRSLAMIDYALRRRFSFYDIRPGFESTSFRSYKENLKDTLFDKIIDAIVKLNETIKKDNSLGEGFCIGHSYFCNQATIEKKWITNVIEFDIIPMLREYWFDNDSKYKEEVDTLLNIIK